MIDSEPETSHHKISRRTIVVLGLIGIAAILSIVLLQYTPFGNDQLCFDYDILVLDGCIDDGVRLDSYYRLVKVYEIDTNTNSIRALTFYDKIQGAISDGRWNLKNIQDAGYVLTDFQETEDKGVKKYAYILFKSNNTNDIREVSQMRKDAISRDRWVSDDPRCMSYLMCASDISTVYHVRLCGTNTLDRHVACLSEIEKPSGPFGSTIDLK